VREKKIKLREQRKADLEIQSKHMEEQLKHTIINKREKMKEENL